MTDRPVRFAAIGLDHAHIFGQVKGLLDQGCELVGTATDDDHAAIATTVRGMYPDVPVKTEAELIGDDSVDLVVTAAVPCPGDRRYLEPLGERDRPELPAVGDGLLDGVELFERGAAGLVGHHVLAGVECGDGFFTAAGFSGHGLQHAPAVGRGVAEWFSRGRYESIDLTAFSYRRIIDRRPLPDDGPKA